MLTLEDGAVCCGRQSKLGPQPVPRVAPGADAAFAEAKHQTMEQWAQKPELRQVRGRRQDRRVVDRQEGDRLKRLCEERLKSAQARIEQIAFGSDGKPSGVTPFDAD